MSMIFTWRMIMEHQAILNGITLKYQTQGRMSLTDLTL